jgi:RNA recognition motif-containing protein
MSNRTVHVGNVGSRVGEDSLKSFFSSIGQVTNIKMAGDPNYPSRFAFIEFADQEQALAACKLNGADLAGKPLKITMAKKAITTSYSSNYQRSYNSAPASDPTPRTIYVTGLDSSLSEAQVLDFFSGSGQVTNYRFCGDATAPQRFAFIEFADPNMASAAVQMTGTVLGKYPIRISPSKSAIQNAAPRPNYSNEQLDQISRTIHVGNLDVQVTDSYIRAIFERSSGPIARIALAGETSYASRFAFIEFFSRECAQDALKMNGVIVAGKQIRVNMSRSPIMTNTGPPPHGYNRPYQQDYYNQSYSPDEYHSPYRGPSYPPSTSSTYDQHSEPIPQDNRDQQDHHNVTELSHTSHQNNNQRAKVILLILG